MKLKIVIRDRARNDIISASTHLATQATQDVANKWLMGIASAIDSLQTFPTGAALARENGSLAGVELRQLNYKSHRIIFTIRKQEVHILHIRHTAQDNADLTDQP